MLKYHPSRPLGRLHREYFKEIVLAFDLLSKLNKHATDFLRTDQDLYKEWIDLDKSFALEQVDLYSKMSYNDFEKEFLPGCFTISKEVVFLFFFVVATVAMYVPIDAYKGGMLPGVALFYISVGYTIPLFIVIYRIIYDEKFIIRKICVKIKMAFFLLKMRLRKRLSRSQIEDGNNINIKELNQVKKITRYDGQ